jgi:hypothetical protein
VKLRLRFDSNSVVKLAVIEFLHFRSMSNTRRHHRSLGQITEPQGGWKTRPINGFEKYFFSNSPTAQSSAGPFAHRTLFHPKVDPARSIYPRNAMGDLLVPLNCRRARTSPPLYLPQYNLVKPRSPKWTIKGVSRPKEVVHYVGPMFYNSANDRSQLPCRSGWTQVGRTSSVEGVSSRTVRKRCRSFPGYHRDA